MSMMRASGAMPIITALQIATASFAVPKSVINTIVGRAAGFFGASSGGFPCPAQPEKASTAKSKIAGALQRRRRNCTASPWRARGEKLFTSWHSLDRHKSEKRAARWPSGAISRSDRPIRQSTRRLRPLAILLVKFAMLVIRAGQLPLDEEIAHLRLQFERIAVSHNNIRDFARLQRAQLIRQTKNLRGVQHHRFQGLVMRQSVSHRGSRILWQPSRKRRAETRKRDGNPRSK